MSKLKVFALLCASQMFLQNTAIAQGGNPDFMRSIGKIYVVVAVIVTIFIGLIIFLIFLEKKLSRLERRIDEL